MRKPRKKGRKMSEDNQSKQIVITKETLIPIGLVIALITGAIWVAKIGWIADQVTVRAAENSIEIKANKEEIDEVKTKFLEAVSNINLQLAELKGVERGKKITSKEPDGP